MQTFSDISKLYKALADPSRLRILNILGERKMCVCEVTEILGLATSTVSQHLSILRDAGLIQQEKDGKWINYYLTPRPTDQRVRSLFAEMRETADNEEAKKDRQKAATIDRAVICRT